MADYFERKRCRGAKVVLVVEPSSNRKHATEPRHPAPFRKIVRPGLAFPVSTPQAFRCLDIDTRLNAPPHCWHRPMDGFSVMTILICVSQIRGIRGAALEDNRRAITPLGLEGMQTSMTLVTVVGLVGMAVAGVLLLGCFRREKPWPEVALGAPDAGGTS